MKAVVLVEEQNLQVLDIPKPTMFEDDHILVKVEACGVCGSDIRYYYGENPWAMHTLGYQVKNEPNITLGHEFAGVVVETKSEKYAHLLNKRVVVQPWKGCGVCNFCKTGRENLCQETRHLGHGQGWPKMEFYPGAMAEYCLAWGDYVYEIPENMSFEKASLSDILGVAIHTVNQSKIIPNSDVICLGGGPAGIYIALLALSRGASKAFLVENSPSAREIIKRFDNCIAIDPDNTNNIEEISSHISNIGCSVIYDSIGSSDVMQKYIQLLSPNGYYVNMATQETDLLIPSSLMSAERVFTTSSNALYAEIKESVELLVSKDIPFEDIITHRCTFETFKETFELLLTEPKKAYKVILEIN